MRRWLRGLAFAAILAVAWAIASKLAKSELLPGPLAVAHALALSFRDGTLTRAVVTTVMRLLLGYGVAIAAGIPLGALLARSALAKEMLGPIVLGMSAVPSVC